MTATDSKQPLFVFLPAAIYQSGDKLVNGCLPRVDIRKIEDKSIPVYCSSTEARPTGEWMLLPDGDVRA